MSVHSYKSNQNCEHARITSIVLICFVVLSLTDFGSVILARKIDGRDKDRLYALKYQTIQNMLDTPHFVVNERKVSQNKNGIRMCAIALIIFIDVRCSSWCAEKTFWCSFTMRTKRRVHWCTLWVRRFKPIRVDLNRPTFLMHLVINCRVRCWRRSFHISKYQRRLP